LQSTWTSSFRQDGRMYGSYMPYSNRYLNKLMSGSICTETKFYRREKLPNVGEEFIIGRKEEKKKIVASLLQSMAQHITILPIYGIGGIGKTTIAKLIYYDTNFNSYS
jgi:Holliday junction resolvasome RuvABC ATP-dependent DNA helicase subunit